MVEATTTSRHARSEQRKGKAACVFSVIVPVFNVEPFLLEALDSLASQTRTDFEVLIVDDGSTDRSPEIAQEYCRRDSRFSYHRQDNAGASSARNRGIALASGTYLYFMDGDDRIDTDTLERCLEALLANDVDIVFFNAQVFPTDAPNYPLYRDYYTRPSLTSPVSGTRFLQASLEQQRYFVQPCCYVARRAAIGTLRFVEGVMYEDNHFLVALLTHGPLRVSVLERRFFHRRLRSGSVMTSPRGERHYRSLLVVVMRIGELPFPILSSGERAALLGPVFDSLLGDLHSLSARMRITPRRRLDNLRALMHAARHAPRHILTLKRIALAVAPELYRLRSGR